MAAKIKVLNNKARKGERMVVGSGWRLVVEKRRKRVLLGTLLGIHNAGNVGIAVFSVPN